MCEKQMRKRKRKRKSSKINYICNIYNNSSIRQRQRQYWSGLRLKLLFSELNDGIPC